MTKPNDFRYANLKNLFWTNGSRRKPEEVPENYLFQSLPNKKITWVTPTLGNVKIRNSELNEGTLNYVYLNGYFYFADPIAVDDDHQTIKTYALVYDIWVNNLNVALISGNVKTTNNLNWIEEKLQTITPIITSPLNTHRISLSHSEIMAGGKLPKPKIYWTGDINETFGNRRFLEVLNKPFYILPQKNLDKFKAWDWKGYKDQYIHRGFHFLGVENWQKTIYEELMEYFKDAEIELINMDMTSTSKYPPEFRGKTTPGVAIKKKGVAAMTGNTIRTGWMPKESEINLNGLNKIEMYFPLETSADLDENNITPKVWSESDIRTKFKKWDDGINISDLKIDERYLTTLLYKAKEKFINFGDYDKYSAVIERIMEVTRTDDGDWVDYKNNYSHKVRVTWNIRKPSTAGPITINNVTIPTDRVYQHQLAPWDFLENAEFGKDGLFKKMYVPNHILEDFFNKVEKGGWYKRFYNQVISNIFGVYKFTSQLFPMWVADWHPEYWMDTLKVLVNHLEQSPTAGDELVGLNIKKLQNTNSTTTFNLPTGNVLKKLLKEPFFYWFIMAIYGRFDKYQPVNFCNDPNLYTPFWPGFHIALEPSFLRTDQKSIVDTASSLADTPVWNPLTQKFVSNRHKIVITEKELLTPFGDLNCVPDKDITGHNFTASKTVDASFIGTEDFKVDSYSFGDDWNIIRQRYWAPLSLSFVVKNTYTKKYWGTVYDLSSITIPGLPFTAYHTSDTTYRLIDYMPTMPYHQQIIKKSLLAFPNKVPPSYHLYANDLADIQDNIFAPQQNVAWKTEIIDKLKDSVIETAWFYKNKSNDSGLRIMSHTNKAPWYFATDKREMIFKLVGTDFYIYSKCIGNKHIFELFLPPEKVETYLQKAPETTKPIKKENLPGELEILTMAINSKAYINYFTEKIPLKTKLWKKNYTDVEITVKLLDKGSLQNFVGNAASLIIKAPMDNIRQVIEFNKEFVPSIGTNLLEMAAFDFEKQRVEIDREIALKTMENRERQHNTWGYVGMATSAANLARNALTGNLGAFITGAVDLAKEFNTHNQGSFAIEMDKNKMDNSWAYTKSMFEAKLAGMGKSSIPTTNNTSVIKAFNEISGVDNFNLIIYTPNYTQREEMSLYYKYYGVDINYDIYEPSTITKLIRQYTVNNMRYIIQFSEVHISNVPLAAHRDYLTSLYMNGVNIVAGSII